MLRYGKIVIDYMRERFYFSRMAKSCWRWLPKPGTWNITREGTFRVTTVWDNLKDQLEFGDRVVNINGKNLSSVAQSQLEIDALLDAIEGDSAYIIILKEGRERKVEIKRF
ncbi:MAG: hypothetical protein ACLU4J_10645 [Butyricimonas paravirosa]